MAEGASSRVHILFISAAVAEGRILHQGYLLWLYCGEIPCIVFTMPTFLFEIQLLASKPNLLQGNCLEIILQFVQKLYTV